MPLLCHDFTRIELEHTLRAQGLGAEDAAKDIFRALYNKDGWSFEKALGVKKNISKKLLHESVALFEERLPTLIQSYESGYDRSVKFLLAYEDHARVEAVLMPETSRLTLCVSSQVGCAQKCSFCYTGRMGLKRSLACFEIIGQIQLAHRFLEEHPAWLQRVGLPVGQRITNVVFMGMGEPMDNVPQVIKAIDIMIDPFGLALAPRRVTVSTAGHGDGLKLFMTSPLKVGLALSLHSPFSGERSKWMPINRRYPIEDIVELLTDYAHKRSLKFLVQYTVFKGQNDTPSHAQALVNLLKDRPVKVNLIPYNPIGPARFECPTGEDLQALQTALLRGGLRVMVRYSKGQDIAAACGQLVVEGDIHT